MNKLNDYCVIGRRSLGDIYIVDLYSVRQQKRVDSIVFGNVTMKEDIEDVKQYAKELYRDMYKGIEL